MKVELNVKTLAVCSVVLVGLIAGGVYFGNYMSRKSEEKATAEAVSRAFYGGTPDELAKRAECQKTRAEYIVAEARKTDRKLMDETVAKNDEAIARKATKKEIDSIWHEYEVKSDKLSVSPDDIFDPAVEDLARKGIIKVPERLSCH